MSRIDPDRASADAHKSQFETLGVSSLDITIVEGADEAEPDRAYEEKGLFESIGDFFMGDEDQQVYNEGLKRGGYLLTARVADGHYVSLTEGVAALALLCGLQFVVAWLSTRSGRFQNLVKSQPTFLFFRGKFLDAILKSERATREEVYAARRASGASDLSIVDAVVLETDGTFSVLTGALGRILPRWTTCNVRLDRTD